MADKFDRDIEELDREIAKRLHAAFDDIEPDAEASARMLTALKDAEAMRKIGGNEPAVEPAVAAPARPRKRIAIWKVATPIAAVLIVAAVGFGVAGQIGPKAGIDESASNVAAEAVIDDSVAAGDAAAEDAAMELEADSMAGEALDAKGIALENPAEEFTFVTLADGTELTVEANGDVDEDLLGAQVAEAEAFDSSGTQSIPCTVYEYEGSDDYAVVYPDEPDGEAYIAHLAE